MDEGRRMTYAIRDDDWQASLRCDPLAARGSYNHKMVIYLIGLRNC
jgi:hypothetical protein